MLGVVAKRLGAAFAVALVVSLLTFVALHAIPGDAAVLQLGLDASPEKLETLRKAMGTDRPLPLQYVDWIGGVLAGDWGQSSVYGRGVIEVIASALPTTVALAVYATLMALVVAVPLGVASALHPGSLADVVARTVMQAGAAMPSFLLAVLLTVTLGLGSDLFPVSGLASPDEGLGGYLLSLTLPAIALSLGECGLLVRTVRSSTIASFSRDYMLSARIKGLSGLRTRLAYGLRGACVAPLTVVGVQLAKLLGGTAVVESVFALPGLGRLLITSVEQRDVMLMQGIVLLVTLVVVAVSALVDLAVMAVDPRVRASSAGGAR